MNVWQVSMDVAIVTFQEEKGNKHKTHPNVNSEISPTFHRGQIPVQNRKTRHNFYTSRQGE